MYKYINKLIRVFTFHVVARLLSRLRMRRDLYRINNYQFMNLNYLWFVSYSRWCERPRGSPIGKAEEKKTEKSARLRISQGRQALSIKNYKFYRLTLGTRVGNGRGIQKPQPPNGPPYLVLAKLGYWIWGREPFRDSNDVNRTKNLDEKRISWGNVYFFIFLKCVSLSAQMTQKEI